MSPQHTVTRLTCRVQSRAPSAARHLPVVIWPQIHVVAGLHHERPGTAASTSSGGWSSVVPCHAGAAALVVQQSVQDDAAGRQIYPCSHSAGCEEDWQRAITKRPFHCLPLLVSHAAVVHAHACTVGRGAEGQTRSEAVRWRGRKKQARGGDGHKQLQKIRTGLAARQPTS